MKMVNTRTSYVGRRDHVSAKDSRLLNPAETLYKGCTKPLSENMSLAYDWVRETWQEARVKLRETRHRMDYDLYGMDRDRTLRVFKCIEWNYTFGFDTEGVESHASGRVFRGIDNSSTKTVWGKLMTTQYRGFNDACNTFLLGCSHEEQPRCGPKVLGIYKVNEAFVVVVTEDATDTINRDFPTLGLKPGFGDFKLTQAEVDEFYLDENDSQTLARRKPRNEKKYREFGKQFKLFDVAAYSRTYVFSFTDRHAGNLLRYYNPKTGAVRFLQIDIESDGRFNPTVMDDIKAYLLGHNGSRSIGVAYMPGDTILDIKTRIGDNLALRTPGGRKFPAKQQILRTLNGVEMRNDAVVGVLKKNVLPVRAGQLCGLDYFVWSMAGATKIMLVNPYPQSDGPPAEQRLYPGMPMGQPDAIIDSQLERKYATFLRLYGHLYSRLLAATTKPKKPKIKRAIGSVRNATDTREFQTMHGVTDRDQLDEYYLNFQDPEAAGILLAAGYKQKALARQGFPPATIAAAAHEPEVPEVLPSGWEAKVDALGRTFYVNHKAKIWEWVLPTPEGAAEGKAITDAYTFRNRQIAEGVPERVQITKYRSLHPNVKKSVLLKAGYSEEMYGCAIVDYFEGRAKDHVSKR